MQPSPDLRNLLGLSEQIVRVFEQEANTHGSGLEAMDAALRHFVSIYKGRRTDAEGELGRAALAEQFAPVVLASLALWEDHHAKGGLALLEYLEHDWTRAPDLKGPAGHLASVLVLFVADHDQNVPRVLGRARYGYEQAWLDDEAYWRRRALRGAIAAETPVRWLLNVQDFQVPGARDLVEDRLLTFSSAATAWMTFLAADHPNLPVEVGVMHADGSSHPLRPGGLRRAAAEELVAGSEWKQVRETALGEAEVAWLTHRMRPGDWPRYFLDSFDGRGPSIPAQVRSAALEAATRLSHPGILSRMADLSESDVTRQVREIAAEEVYRCTQHAAAVLQLADDPAQAQAIGDADLVAAGRLLYSMAAQHPFDYPGIPVAVNRVLTELTARDVDAQRLRAVLEPPQAEAWLERSRVDHFDGSPELDRMRQQQTEQAQKAAEHYVRARLLEDTGLLPNPDEIRDMALSKAGIDTPYVIDEIFPAAKGPRGHHRDAAAWIAAHPMAGHALRGEESEADHAAQRADQRPSSWTAAQAAYWQLRAERTAVIYGVLAHLTDGAARASTGSDGVIQAMTDEASRAMTRLVFGSEQRAAQLIAAGATYLDQLHTQTAQNLAADEQRPGTFPTAEGESNFRATQRNLERRTLSEALGRAGAELERLYPGLTAPVLIAGRDTTRLQQTIRSLAAAATTRREEPAQPPARHPHPHDPAQQAAQTQPHQGTGGPTPQ